MGSAADSISHQEDSQNPPRKVSDPNLVEGEKTTANDIGQFATLDGGFHLRGLASDLPVGKGSSDTEDLIVWMGEQPELTSGLTTHRTIVIQPRALRIRSGEKLRLDCDRPHHAEVGDGGQHGESVPHLVLAEK